MLTRLPDLLKARVRRHGADPLLTYYDLSQGERTELSATSVSNWVDKTSNLLEDAYDVGPGDVLDLTLAEQAPGHWITLIVALAGWQVGATLRVGRASSAGVSSRGSASLSSGGGPAAVTVVGPDLGAAEHLTDGAVLACALHPLGLGFAAPLPAGVDDFAVEVRGQPDVYPGSVAAGDEVAWHDPDRELTRSELVDAVGADRPRRVLVRPSDPWHTLREALIRPLVTDGSSVVVVGDDPERLAHLAATERVDR